jgi:hypothetical protein
MTENALPCTELSALSFCASIDGKITLLAVARKGAGSGRINISG